MQPDWLGFHGMLGVYDWVAVRLPGVLMGVLVSLSISVFFFGFNPFVLFSSIFLGGLLGGLLSAGGISQRPAAGGGNARSILRPRLLQWLLIGALIGLGSGLSSGLSVGLIFGVCSILVQFLLRKHSTTEPPSQTPPALGSTKWQRLLKKREVRNGLVVGLPFGLSYGLSIGLSAGLGWLSAGLGYGLSAGLLGWLSAGLSAGLSAWVLSILLIGRSTAVQPTDVLVWSWRSLRKSLFSKSHASRTLRVAALIGLSGGLGVGLSSGLGSGLSFGLSGGLSQVLSYRLSHWLSDGLSVGLSAGPSTGLLVGLLNGGLASFRHYVVRFLLWRSGAVPWRYISFLDYAAERILLRKVGGGYIFLHRLLLDFFAARETTPVLNEPTERKQVNTPAPASPSNVSSEPMVPDALPDLSAPTISLAPPTNPSEARRSLPCGHELHIPGARFCSVCGAPITMPNTPT